MEKVYLVYCDKCNSYELIFKNYNSAWSFCVINNALLYLDSHTLKEFDSSIIEKLTEDTDNDYFHVFEKPLLE